MRILLINLARAEARRAKMTTQFAELNLPFEILEATDGRTLTEADRAFVDHKARQRITPYPLTDNEIGCWISHRRAIESVAQGDDSMAVIIEDDITCTPDFGATIQAIESNGGSFDFIFLHRKFKKGEAFVPCRPLMAGRNLGRVRYASMGCLAYVVSREGARKFLARTSHSGHAVDKEIHRYWVNGLDIYGLDRPVVEHADDGHSYIDETRGQNRPQERKKYPDSGRISWRFQRALTRLYDSLHKRLVFPSYVRRGKMDNS